MVFKNGHVRSDFACKCGCGLDTIDAETLEVLIDVENHFGKKAEINSCCRCHNHNEFILRARESYVPNTSKSQHLICRAIDFYIDGVSPALVYEYLDKKYPDKYGIGKYSTFTHLDTRGRRARF